MRNYNNKDKSRRYRETRSETTNPWIKDKVITMLRREATTEAVLKAFPGITRGNIAALRAHLTRGTYDLS
jgi:hypothetical protein